MFKVFTVLFALAAFQLGAQPATGGWRMHIASKAVDVAAGNNRVFAALETGLLEYDIEANETSLWTDVNSLSDIELSCIYYHPGSGDFFAGYKNGNIDRISGNTVSNIPAIKLAEIQGNKTVNAFIASGDYIYASTGVGIVVINPENNEIKDTYYPGGSDEPILEVAFLNDSIYAITKSLIWKSNRNSTALADPGQWTSLPNVQLYDPEVESFGNLFTSNNKLYVLKQHSAFNGDTIFNVTASGLHDALNLTFDIEITSARADQNQVLVTLYDGVYLLDNNFGLQAVINDFAAFGPVKTMNSCLLNNKMYIADFNSGILEMSGTGNRRIAETGPLHNSFYALSGAKDKIAVAGGVIEKTSFQYNVSGAYVFEDETWRSYNRTNEPLWDNKNVFDISSVAVNPSNTDQVAIGSYSEIPLSISENGGELTQTFNQDNSPLAKHAVGIHDNICVSDVEYDSKGNLWVVQCFSLNPLKVYTKEKQWYEFPVSSSIQNKYTGRMIVDQNNHKWVSINEVGLAGYNDNNTISDPSDDQYVLLNEGANTGALPDRNISALAVDHDNELWIGTPNGFAVLYSSESAFGASPGDYNAQRIKIDFEGNVEYVLGNTSITDIEVDGGNRKWMGTANAGIFLLSPDGLEVLASYTKENSSLISNNIIDMEFNDKTGELFIITDAGMVSLRTDASQGDDKYEDVVVFPNPVKPEFNGLITIQGIKEDSDVKFTDAAGNLVFRTTSHGGTATWDGKTLEGKKATAGVYLIWTASNTEKGRKVGKVVILN
ncbi:MAG: hypothetical protein K0R65_2797 [Crocinitomicaceae bacterium]|jgi:hypothetical protein|nr:hypothetical protein [Crocinitomicaceae bacterium]